MLGGGGAHRYSQHLGGRGRLISMSLRPAWCTKGSSRPVRTVTQRNSFSKNKKERNAIETKRRRHAICM